MRRAPLGHAYVMGEHAHDGEVVVYRLYGHYSFNARDGGEQVTLQLAAGYFVGPWFDGTKMIMGRRLAVSVEQALYHGFAKIVA
jgi:hypothetical protein